MQFECRIKRGKKIETWKANVEYLKEHGDFFDVIIFSRSSIRLMVGCGSWGNFVCVPDFKVGCYLSDFKDISWNIKKLTQLLGRIDGITAATVIFEIADILEHNIEEDF